MRRLNLILIALVVVALAASVAIYRVDQGRADRFERGRKLLPSFDPDTVATIQLEAGGEVVTLERSGDRFSIAEADGYPARNDAVNRLLRDLGEATLDRDLGNDPELVAEVGIEPPADGSAVVRLEDASGERLVDLRLGRPRDDGAGRFVERRASDPGRIFVTNDRLDVTTGVDSYLDRQILDLDASAIVRLEGSDYVLERAEQGEALELVAAPAGREVDASAVGRARGVFSRLELDEVYLADDPTVADLDLVDTHRVLLDDDSGYILSTATRDGSTFARIRAFHTVERLEIRRDSSEDELAEKAEVLERADEVQAFNQERGSWVYRLAAPSAGKVELRLGDLLKDG